MKLNEIKSTGFMASPGSSRQLNEVKVKLSEIKSARLHGLAGKF